ncbi:MAG: dihydropteroate synthase, partial [Vampirovibrionales bacterium]
LHTMLSQMAQNHAPTKTTPALPQPSQTIQTLFQHRPALTPRHPHPVEGVASLYHAMTFTQENTIFAIGERCNANGSKAFREAQAQEDWDTCVAMARDQAQEGSHALDVCVAYVGRDELSDMTTLIEKLRGSSTIPLVIDSTEYPVLERALEHYGGKAIINSINFEDGEAPAEKRMLLAKKHGASVIALTIDEEGMAKTPESKLAIADRLRAFACGQFGLPEHDLMIDPLTFTICTGNEDDRKLGLWTLEAIEMIHHAMPKVQIILGLSNISFGLKPTARKVLNSVYLHEAVKRGMTGAIIHVSKIVPMHQIPEAQQTAALDLIYDQRDPSQPITPENDPLQKFIALFQDEAGSTQSASSRLPERLEDRLKQRIVDGLKKGLEEDLTLALNHYAPLEIINTLLLDGMKVVGELFGSGKMQLPFVLQSAETMKLAVKFLEPYMEKAEGQHKGTVILATVKGDVHDIGKNLVDIILTNNGYKVINLGIKQPIDAILQAAEAHQAHAIGMSGLLVKSTVIMRENLQYMGEKKLNIPVFLGGAALTQAYVETDCYQAYAPSHQVAYVKDAFESLDLMGRIMAGSFQQYLDERQQAYHQVSISPEHQDTITEALNAQPSPSTLTLHALPTVSITPAIPIGQHHGNTLTPAPRLPLGVQPLSTFTPKALLPRLAYERLFISHWGYTPPEGHLPKRSHPEYQEALAQWATKEGLYEHLHRILTHPEVSETLAPKALWGTFWVKAYQPKDPRSLPELHWFNHHDPSETSRLGVWHLPLATDLPTPEHLAQWVHPDGEAWIHGCVTLGQTISEVARKWFQEDRYHDYLLLHGLLGELTEALSLTLQDMATEATTQTLHRYGAGGILIPDTTLMRDSLTWLEAPQRLGVKFNEETQLLTPEESACFLFVPSPNFTRHGW